MLPTIWNYKVKGVFSKPSGGQIVAQNLCFLRVRDLEMAPSRQLW